MAADSPRAETEGRSYGFLYRKIANAIRTIVMIHRIVFLLLLFSSAMTKVQHRVDQRIKCPDVSSRAPKNWFLPQGFAAGPVVPVRL